jgi:hypothetical protein
MGFLLTVARPMRGFGPYRRPRRALDRLVDLGGIVEAPDPEPQRGVDPLVGQSHRS